MRQLGAACRMALWQTGSGGFFNIVLEQDFWKVQ